jgi:hypothetical protein
MIRLWRNECLRIFYDRLINDKDKDIFTVICYNHHSNLCKCRCAHLFDCKTTNHEVLLYLLFLSSVQVTRRTSRYSNQSFWQDLLSIAVLYITTKKITERSPGGKCRLNWMELLLQNSPRPQVPLTTSTKIQIIFGDFRTCLKPTEPRLYEDAGDFDFMKPHFEEVLDEYNITNKKMNLVMFEDALEHLTRVHRTMRLPQVTYYLTF